ncbi:hypothetical protein NL676_006593 [Syzygium grande]|nr:hypothetical protein NL676_006593 [Syzygium grande]
MCGIPWIGGRGYVGVTSRDNYSAPVPRVREHHYELVHEMEIAQVIQTLLTRAVLPMAPSPTTEITLRLAQSSLLSINCYTSSFTKSSRPTIWDSSFIFLAWGSLPVNEATMLLPALSGEVSTSGADILPLSLFPRRRLQEDNARTQDKVFARGFRGLSPSDASIRNRSKEVCATRAGSRKRDLAPGKWRLTVLAVQFRGVQASRSVICL